jgi:transposase InsO family protein
MSTSVRVACLGTSPNAILDVSKTTLRRPHTRKGTILRTVRDAIFMVLQRFGPLAPTSFHGDRDHPAEEE